MPKVNSTIQVYSLRQPGANPDAEGAKTCEWLLQSFLSNIFVHSLRVSYNVYDHIHPLCHPSHILPLFYSPNFVVLFFFPVSKPRKQTSWNPVWVGQVVNYSWAWDLPWRVTHISNITPLKKTDPSSHTCNQMPKAPSPGVGLYAHLPSSLLGILSGICLWGSYAWCHSLCEFVCTSALLSLENTASLKLSTTSGSYSLSTSSST